MGADAGAPPDKEVRVFTNAGVQGTDLAALFNAVPNPYVILTPEFIIVGMNEAYLRVTMPKTCRSSPIRSSGPTA
ncbi:MAG: hypothetical protein B7Y12_13225 [Rhizobiales bacterium 24-66-13]|nr:MAG: hypothetical protein B7Y12_13225 [Rhizobiales bacterium 24-66-13]